MDRILYAAGGLRVGCFRRYPWQRPFADTGPIREGPLLVFPRTSVVIRHRDREPVMADPTRVMLYNPGQEYTRRAVTNRGDECEWFAFPPEIVADAMRDVDPAVADRGDRPFLDVWAPSPRDAYLLQRRVTEHLLRSERRSELFVEESMMLLLARVVARRPESTTARRATTAAEHRAVADACREVVARRLGERTSLRAIAAAVGVSPFHLARLFRRDAGTTIHTYVHELRLRTALQRVADGDEVARIAVDLGYASHSHFTARFRRFFGVTPSAFRRRLRARS